MQNLSVDIQNLRSVHVEHHLSLASREGLVLEKTEYLTDNKVRFAIEYWGNHGALSRTFGCMIDRPLRTDEERFFSNL